MKKLITLAIALAMLATLILPVTALADENGNTTITANFQSMSITAPTGKTNMTLAATTADQSLVSSTGQVTSTVLYDVTAVDAVDTSKADGDNGYMTSWTGSAYNNGIHLTDRVKVGSTMTDYGQTAAYLNTGATPAAITIIDGGQIGSAVNANIVVTQETQSGDAPLTPPNTYRIVITFTIVAGS
jgi:hypothetical protein